MRLRPPAHSVLALAFASSACLTGHLSVDVSTVVQGDGSCTRRVVYAYEAKARTDADPLLPLPDDQDPLRLLHRFPKDDRWTIDHAVGPASHTVTLEGRFPSPNDIDWDYWRAASPNARPARNYFSFAVGGEQDHPQYEYFESFLDPASPVEWLQRLGQLIKGREKALSQALHRGLGERGLTSGEVRRAVHEELTAPLLLEVSRLTSRPVFGPRERQEAEAVLERLDAFTDALAARLVDSAPGLDAETARTALDAAFEEAVPQTDLDAETGGEIFDPDTEITFHATLTLPAPIVRANTCFQGDTATWDFRGEDLYGRGFEMSAVAVSP
jgi:hypothetical protein